MSNFHKWTINSYKWTINSYKWTINPYKWISKLAEPFSALAAMGNAQPQLKFHITAGLNIGLSQENIKEIMYLMTVYAGFPSTINGMNVLKEVINENK